MENFGGHHISVFSEQKAHVLNIANKCAKNRLLYSKIANIIFHFLSFLFKLRML